MQQSQPVNFTMDGRAMRAEPGETVLSIARENGISIPTLCHHEALAPNGACRLCVVEVFWGNRSKLVTSCIYTPYEDDRIETNSDRVRALRRMVLELLLARCPGVELLQQLGREYGVREPRLTGAQADEKERCILCGLCVRVCDEVVGQHAIGYEGRGMERSITPPFKDRASACIGCGACVFICPTGALHFQDIDDVRIMKEFQTRVPLAKCQDCGQGYAPGAVLDKLSGVSRGLEEEPQLICPVCRRKAFGKTMSAWMGKQLAGNACNGGAISKATCD